MTNKLKLTSFAVEMKIIIEVVTVNQEIDVTLNDFFLDKLAVDNAR